MEVVSYDYDVFMACKTTAFCDHVIKLRMDKLFNTLACFKAFSSVSPGFKPSQDKKAGFSGGNKGHTHTHSHTHGNHQHRRTRTTNSGTNNRGIRNVEQTPCRAIISDPLKTLQGLLNKMSAANATKICNQIATMTIPSVDVIVYAILDQACKQDTYVKEYVATLSLLMQRQSGADAEIIMQIIVSYLADFHETPFFLVSDAISEKETYDVFCDRVKSKHRSLGKLKVVLELLTMLQEATGPYKSAIFIAWYMASWKRIIDATIHLRDLSAELFLDGLRHVVMSADFITTISIQECTVYTTILSTDVTNHQMPVKLKFKVMDINDLIKAAFLQDKAIFKKN